MGLAGGADGAKWKRISGLSRGTGLHRAGIVVRMSARLVVADFSGAELRIFGLEIP